jgi:hypothetical protein
LEGTIGKTSILICLLFMPLSVYSQAIKSHSPRQPEQLDPPRSESKRDELPAALRNCRWTLSVDLSIIHSLTSRRSPSSLNSADDIDRSGKASSGAVAAASPIARLELKGSVEMRDGRMAMILRNLDYQRAFSGTARVTLDDGNNERDIVQVAIDLQPSEEKIFPLNEASTPFGDSILVVYDERRTVQLIHSAPFGDKPKTIIAANQSENQPPQTFPEPVAGSNATNLQAMEDLLGDDDEPNSSTDPANPGNPARRERQSRKITVPYVGELEGWTSPAVGSNPPDIPK